MPIIRPISDMRNKFHTISDQCHEEQEPIFLTKNGKGDLVVMSSVARLKDFPEIGSIPKDDRLQKLGYRILSVDD
ncbi:MAG: type II toxin-antitoxin system Phd/YefM family antitoxin [Spirochaetota bacterium]